MPKVEEQPKPPLEGPPGKGLGGGGGPEDTFSLPPEVGLLVLLAVITSLFAALVSAYLVRMGLPDWQALPKPPSFLLFVLGG